MINYYKYVFSEDELDTILNKKKYNHVDKLETKNGEKYTVKIFEEGFYIYLKDVENSIYYEFDKDLIFTPMLELRLSDDDFIRASLDVHTNRKDKKSFYIQKIDKVLSRGIDLNYLRLFLFNTRFSNNEEFMELCVYYIAYRLHNKEDAVLNINFIEKLEFYGYENDCMEDKTSFNNSKNSDFLDIVILALEVLYKYDKNKRLNLGDYNISSFHIKIAYLNYYDFIT